MMTTQALTWAQRMSGDMRIAGLSERTEAAYVWAVRQLLKFQRGRSPDELSADDVRDYLVWLRGEKRAAPGTLKIIPAGQRNPEAAGWVSAGLLEQKVGTRLRTPLCRSPALTGASRTALKPRPFSGYASYQPTCVRRIVAIEVTIDRTVGARLADPLAFKQIMAGLPFSVRAFRWVARVGRACWPATS